MSVYVINNLAIFLHLYIISDAVAQVQQSCPLTIDILCTTNLESLFVQTTNTTAPLFVGVVYRPPLGSKSEAIAELQKIMQCLPNKKVIILGVFNNDLLKPDSQLFESAIYGKGGF